MRQSSLYSINAMLRSSANWRETQERRGSQSKSLQIDLFVSLNSHDLQRFLCAKRSPKLENLKYKGNRRFFFDIAYFLPSRVFSAEDDLTVNIQRAIFKASSLEGGCVLYFGPGDYSVSHLTLSSDLTLFLDEGCTIKSIVNNEEEWELIEPLPSYGQGREFPGKRYRSFIDAENVRNLAIDGDGVIDGNGSFWWNLKAKKQLKKTRPHLLELRNSQNVEISGITLKNSPFWTIHLFDSSNCDIHHLNIFNPPLAPNTDGITPDSCVCVLIRNNFIFTGDDAISIKSGWDNFGVEYNKPSAEISIKNNILSSKRCAAICLGSEMSGGIKKVEIFDNFIFNSCQAFHLKTARGRGGYITHVLMKQCVLRNVEVGIRMNAFYRGHPVGVDIDSLNEDKRFLPKVSGIHFEDVCAIGGGIPIEAHGLADSPFVNITFEALLFHRFTAENILENIKYTLLSSSTPVHSEDPRTHTE